MLIMLIKNIRPLLGPARCRFTVTCTPFAIKELSSKSLFLALLSIHRRLLLCNPFTPKKYIDRYNNL